MKIIGKFYDKISLAVVFLTVTTVYIFEFLGEQENISTSNFGLSSHSWDRESSGIIFKTDIPNQLMPGEHIYFHHEDLNFTKAEISEINFKRRDDISIQLNSGDQISGRVKQKEGLVFTKKWKSVNSPVLIDVDGKTKPVQMRTISKIKGNPEYVLDEQVDLTQIEDMQPFFYQRIPSSNFVYESTKRPQWMNIDTDNNESIFDLFTPPLIYLIEGKLTTTLPDAPIEEEEKEPFGATITSFEKIPYRFRLSSWIGDSPYIEDTEQTKKSGRVVRNRLQVDGVYELIEDPKPGRPSLVKVDENSSKKRLTLKYLTVQNINQKNGGVKPVGRALLEDHLIGKKPFEVNSLMDNVFLGQFKIGLSFKIKKEDSMEVFISDSDGGKEIEYNGRKYLVRSLDGEKKSVVLRKISSIPSQSEDLELISP